MWNNFTILVFVAWIIIMPLFVSMNVILDPMHLQILIIFDVAFMLDRVLDLFVGYYNPNGLQEHRLSHVIYQNLSAKFFVEILIIACPIILNYFNENSLYYLGFKILRYSRLFEIDNQISEILDFYGQSKTVFDIKRMRKQMNILEFGLETFIHLHMMTCIQIILCTHRDFDKSWMGA